MPDFREIISQQRVFLIIFGVFFVALGVLLMCFDKAELHLMLSSNHNAFFDVFFKHYTGLCQWAPYVVGVLLVLYRYSASLLILLSQAIEAVMIYVAKQIYHAPRPVKWFAENMPEVQLTLVEGVKAHSQFSFPSGHSAAFFAFFFSLSLLTSNRWLQALYCCLAILGCYSRIYLSQHFAVDIWAGSLIGVVSVMLMLIWKFPMRIELLNQKLKIRKD